jgi:hypothetical protein
VNARIYFGSSADAQIGRDVFILTLSHHSINGVIELKATIIGKPMFSLSHPQGFMSFLLLIHERID